MTIADKVKAVEEVFGKLEAEAASFQQWSGLYCKTGCAKCCLKPDIAATVLEFLPFAHHLYQKGLSELWLEKIIQTESSFCVVLDQSMSSVAGACSAYPYRGLICRLFGYSARKNKYDKKDLVTCQVIKTELKEVYDKATAAIVNDGAAVPMMSHYHMQLMAIDEFLTRKLYPVNEAIRLAIEEVLSYYAYREGVSDIEDVTAD